MSVKIKKLTGEIFDLPTNYVIEAEKNNPLFSKKGSQTISITFPATDNNRKQLGYANRLDKKDKPTGPIPVVVESGATQQAGLMAINAASDSSFSANIGWDESEMYTNMNTIQLKDLPNLGKYTYTAGGNSQDTRLDAMLAHLTRVMKETEDADYYVFPLVLKKDVVETGETTETGEPIIQATYYEVLNDTVRFIQGTPSNGAMGELLAWNNRVLRRYMDGREVLFDVPKGYGVSPFLKVWRLLEIIFDNYGFSLENNPFKEHRQLKRLVVLNNTMDSILTGRLYYKDMMPDMSVKEFLDSLYNKFGLQYFVDSNTKTVTLKFWKDMLTSTSGEDLTQYKTAPGTISYSASKQIKLIANREIEGTEVKWNTFEEFLKNYDYQFVDKSTYQDISPNYSSIFYADPRVYTINDYAQGTKRISSDFFDWDKKAKLAYEEIKMEDLCLPLGSGHKWNLLEYLVGYKHAYSDVSVSGKTVESEQSPAKLAFAFGWGKTHLQGGYEWNYFFASQDNRNEFGDFIHDPQGNRYDLSLTCHREDGLFNRFWKEFDAFLRHSNYSLEIKLKLPESVIANLRMHQTVFIDNQLFLPEKIKFKQNTNDAISECTFRTVRLYGPYDLETEQKIETYYPQTYYWRAVSNKVPNIEQELIESGVAFSIEDGDRSSTDERRRSLLWLPPTEQEFLNQSTRSYTYKYVVAYQIPPLSFKQPVENTVTYYPTRVLE